MIIRLGPVRVLGEIGGGEGDREEGEERGGK